MITPSPSQKLAPLNVPLALGASVLIALTETLLNPLILLAFFVSQLTDSLDSVAWMAAIGLLGWFLPQLVTPWLGSLSIRQMPWALGASLVRAAAVIFLAYVGYRDQVSDSQRLRSFFVCYVAFCVASGFAQTPTNEMIARAIPAERRGWLIKQRNLWSGLVAIAAGFVAQRTLGPEGPGFPRSMTLLFVAAAAAISAATFFLARIREPQFVPRSDLTGRVPTFGSFVRVLKDGAYRRYALYGAIGAVATLGDVFFIVYARRELGMPGDMIGFCLIAFTTASLLSWPLWSWLIEIYGARAALQAATAVRVTAPLLLMFIPYAIETDYYRDNVDNNRVAFYLAAIPFAILGAALRGYMAGNFGYVMDIAVPERRGAYQVMSLLPLLAAAAAPFAGAEIAQRWGLDRLLMIAVFAGFFAIVSGGLLVSTNMRLRSVSRSWRLRDARS